MRGFILTPTYRLTDGVPEVHLYGTLECGEPCLVIDDRTRPYFFVRQTDADATRRVVPGARVEPAALRGFDGDPVVRVTVAVPGDVPPLRRRLEERAITCFEADVRFAYRYLIDHGIRGAFAVDGAFHHHPSLGRIYRNPALRPARWVPQLKILSVDIETSYAGDELYAIGLHTRDFERVILVHHQVFDHAEPAHSEKAAIRRFLEYLRVIDPDIITGWNVIDFDLAFLARVAHRHGVPFCIGRNDEPFELHRDASFTRDSRAVVCGRQVLDGLSLMRGAFIRLEDYKLETAAQTFLGKGKLLAGAHRYREIEELYRTDPQRLVEYNLQDARLVRELLDHTGLVDLAIERSLLTGMQLDRVGAAIASVDSLYLGALRPLGVVAPSVRDAQRPVPVMGGYVMESTPGLYENVMVFDFKSLYPSIIRTFNIDPLTQTRAPTVGDAVRAPNGACFRRDVPGILPVLLTHLAGEREAAKRSGNGVKANAIKILMNSFYGVLGASASRLFSPDVANAVTSFGQFLIRHAAEHAHQRGYRVLYGDTDSLFVQARERDPTAARHAAETLRADISRAVGDRIRHEFGCDSVLELEFEKLYRRFFLPEVRGGKVGSKKRYAGLLSANGEETIEFVGLEAVRRDWSEVSKRFQRGLLQRIFHDQPVEAFIVEFVASLRAGAFDDQLVYKKALRKELAAYTTTTPPHVRAARKQTGSGGRIIAYVVTMNGPEPVENLTAAPDYAHYITHQLAPVADAILRFLGTDFASIVRPPRQLSLF